MMLFSVVVLPKLSLAQTTSNGGYEMPTNTNLPGSSSNIGIADVLNNFLKWLLAIFGSLALISFVISGIQYFLAAGDDKRMQDAKRNMLYSIIGVAVGLSGFVIIQAIDKALNATSKF